MSRDLDQRPMDTRPDERDDITLPRLGPVGLLRFVWRQLTSMRTALLLLLLLAIAAVPGRSGRSAASTPPAWSPTSTSTAPSARGWTGSGSSTSTPPRGSPRSTCCSSSRWSAACCPAHGSTGTPCCAQPPRAPRRLERLPEHAELEVEASVEETCRPPATALAGQALPHPQGADGEDPHTLSGESGYLRETGNLVFHAALIVVIVGIAIGHLFGWRGDRIVPVGETFSNTISAYDTFSPGRGSTPRTSSRSRSPSTSSTSRSRSGRAGRSSAPRATSPRTPRRPSPPGAPERRQTLKVNGPLKFGGASVFLLGNGYAPVVTVRDARATSPTAAPRRSCRGTTTTCRPARSRSARPSPSSSASRGSSCPPPSRRSRTARARCSPT